MKPFNLEEALAGKPVVTRDGRPVTEIYYFNTVTSGDRIAAVVSGVLQGYLKDGVRAVGCESGLDLFMAPETMQVWINVWRASNGQIYTISEEQMPDDSIQSKRGYIKTVPITIEL